MFPYYFIEALKRVNDPKNPYDYSIEDRTAETLIQSLVKDENLTDEQTQALNQFAGTEEGEAILKALCKGIEKRVDKDINNALKNGAQIENERIRQVFSEVKSITNG